MHCQQKDVCPIAHKIVKQRMESECLMVKVDLSFMCVCIYMLLTISKYVAMHKHIIIF